MNTLATALQRYFAVYARTQRDLSDNTIGAYRDTWRLLIKHLAAASGKPASAIDFDILDAGHVTAFLDHLERDRGNSASTRNTRLTAIRAVLTHAQSDLPEHSATITRILAIPRKRHPKPILEFLNRDETDALLAAPDRTTWTGRRDHVLLALAIQTGLRISELRSLTTADIHLGGAPHVTCLGKGRRRRATPLTKLTANIMGAYLAERATKPGTALFNGPRGQHLSRDAIEHRLAKHLTKAAATCPSIGEKNITMHALRHTAAMNLLAEGVDIAVIAMWLGHQNTHSTDAYLHADMTIKQAAIDRTRPPNTKPGTYQPQPDILDWLSHL
ncbi:MAG: site-specific integrase [Bifidobacteriaceae bacterium]|jgi:site-specific recombinase XerD|nr:site-specific integrase [Bifidobacteriaceae bacterium]